MLRCRHAVGGESDLTTSGVFLVNVIGKESGKGTDVIIIMGHRP